MTEPQLNLLGDHAQPDDEELGSVQRLVVRELRARGPLARDEIGALIHAHRGKHGADERCMWCGVDADPLIAALLRRGLAEKGVEGAVRPDRPTPDARVLETHDELPEGF